LETVLKARALTLDSLLFVNDLQQEHAFKVTISPNYHKPPERKVFGKELYQTIKNENESNKLLNDATYQRKRSAQNFKQNQSTHINYSKVFSYIFSKEYIREHSLHSFYKMLVQIWLQF
jgi:sRNA-binding carbon storage regulator CsrA